MDQKIKESVEKVMKICIETMTVAGLTSWQKTNVRYIDFEDTHNQVYAEIKQLLENYVNASIAMDDVKADKYRQ